MFLFISCMQCCHFVEWSVFCSGWDYKLHAWNVKLGEQREKKRPRPRQPGAQSDGKHAGVYVTCTCLLTVSSSSSSAFHSHSSSVGSYAAFTMSLLCKEQETIRVKVCTSGPQVMLSLTLLMHHHVMWQINRKQGHLFNQVWVVSVTSENMGYSWESVCFHPQFVYMKTSLWRCWVSDLREVRVDSL